MDQDRAKDRKKDWRELCTAAANELDPAKLMNIIAELTRALEERDRKQGNVTRENLSDEALDTRSFQSEPAVG